MANDDTAAAFPQKGRISRVILRVADVDRAGAFFEGLFAWQLERVGASDYPAQRALELRSPAPSCIGAVFVEDPRAPPIRVEFEVTDAALAVAQTRRLGGNGSAAEASDSQGIPLAFAEGGLAALPSPPHPGDIGVLIFDVPDTARARTFHSGMFGRTYHQISSADRWWMDALTIGIFGAPACGVRFWCVVSALDPMIARIGELGGVIIERGAMGPYQVCDCRDDQGTAFGLWYDPTLQLAAE